MLKKNIPCGDHIPNSQHAVIVSLPTMADVIGYEENHSEIIKKLDLAYPRFFKHHYIAKLENLLHSELGLHHDEKVVVCYDRIWALQLITFVDDSRCKSVEGYPFGIAILPNETSCLSHAALFLQHVGCLLSSRHAEDLLIERNIPIEREKEEYVTGGNARTLIKEHLAHIHNCTTNNIFLYPSGMNAFFSVFSTIQNKQKINGKKEWINIGWLYLDTMKILQKFCPRCHYFEIDAINDLEYFLKNHHECIAGMTTEIMTNPLMQTPDVQQLHKLAQRYNIPIIIDISMPTSHNVDVTPYTDIIIESLTKFASGNADVVGGAAIFNDTPWGNDCQKEHNEVGMYERDIQRMANNIKTYQQRMEIINKRALRLIEFFEKNSHVKHVYWSGQRSSKKNYDLVKRESGGYGGVISLVFTKPLKEFYDNLLLRKGPSFGTEFTLCTPYVYLAHYDLVSTDQGRKTLLSKGIDPELLRISVGTEQGEEIIRAFEDALRQS